MFTTIPPFLETFRLGYAIHFQTDSTKFRSAVDPICAFEATRIIIQICCIREDVFIFYYPFNDIVEYN